MSKDFKISILGLLIILVTFGTCNLVNHDFRDNLENSSKSVVYIEVMKKDRFGIPNMGHGSGFFVSKDGYILTNRHVTQNSECIIVKNYKGHSYEGTIVCENPYYDLSLIKVETNDSKPLKFASKKDYKIGTQVYVYGFPYNLGLTVTGGVISARTMDGRFLAIQHDAVINRGCSGGPLLNRDGEVVGVDYAFMNYVGHFNGYGLSIPGVIAKKFIDDTLKE